MNRFISSPWNWMGRVHFHCQFLSLKHPLYYIYFVVLVTNYDLKQIDDFLFRLSANRPKKIVCLLKNLPKADLDFMDMIWMFVLLTVPEEGDCMDMNGNCMTWASNGECDRNPSWMLTNCKVSCEVCDPTTGQSIWIFKFNFYLMTCFIMSIVILHYHCCYSIKW